jgi:hypothetical protein
LTTETCRPEQAAADHTDPAVARSGLEISYPRRSGCGWIFLITPCLSGQHPVQRVEASDALLG